VRKATGVNRSWFKVTLLVRQIDSRAKAAMLDRFERWKQLIDFNAFERINGTMHESSSASSSFFAFRTFKSIYLVSAFSLAPSVSQHNQVDSQILTVAFKLIFFRAWTGRCTIDLIERSPGSSGSAPQVEEGGDRRAVIWRRRRRRRRGGRGSYKTRVEVQWRVNWAECPDALRRKSCLARLHFPVEMETVDWQRQKELAFSDSRVECVSVLVRLMQPPEVPFLFVSSEHEIAAIIESVSPSQLILILWSA
jgi:hypothetical protein